MAKTRAADSEEMKPHASGTQLRTCWRTKQPSTWLNLYNSLGSGDWICGRLSGEARAPVTLQAANTPAALCRVEKAPF